MATKTQPKEVTREACDLAIKLRLGIDPKNGKKVGEPQKWEAVLEETGLNYSQAWLAVASYEAEAAGEIVPPENRTAATVRKLRNQFEAEGRKDSWGMIMVRFGYHPANSREDNATGTQGYVRRLFTEATGIQSAGLRKGRGGRFYLDELGMPLYRGEEDHKKGVGTQLDKDITRPEVAEMILSGMAAKLDKLVASGHMTREKADAKLSQTKAKLEKTATAQPAKATKATAKKATTATNEATPPKPKPTKAAVRRAKKQPPKPVKATAATTKPSPAETPEEADPLA